MQRLSTALAVLALAGAWTPPRRDPSRRLALLRAHPAFKAKVDPRYSLAAAVEAGEAGAKAMVPQSFDEILAELGESVAASVKGPARRLLVECLPPGLNPELEMTCPYDASRELAVVQALLLALPDAAVRVACPSAGDAAMSARAFDGAEGLGRCSFCGLSSAPGAGKNPTGVVKRVFGNAPEPPEYVLVVRPRNSVGDPVIEDVMTVAEAAAGIDATVLLLNPDLGERVALGIHQKDRWASFVQTFEPAYHFSNCFNLERPSCRQIEKGVHRFTTARGWEAFHAIPLLTSIDGDLRRYGRQPGNSPPVPFLLSVGSGGDRPSRDLLAKHMAHGAKLAKVLRAA